MTPLQYMENINNILDLFWSYLHMEHTKSTNFLQFKAKEKWCDEILNMADLVGATLVRVGWTNMVASAVLF